MNAGGPLRGGVTPGRARDSWLWTFVGILGLLLALYLAFPRLDADQAITGLIGVYVLHGAFPTFFWMQDHAGVPESYIAAPLFFLSGISRRVLDLVPALSTLALSIAVYRTGALLFGRVPGLLSILFTTVVSAYVAANYTLARAYYWLAPRLTFEAPDIIVAQPFNDRYPPFTLAVDRSSRPAYVVQAGVETFRAWMEAIRVTAREETAGGYRIFHDFTPPPDTRPLARTPFTVSASPGCGDAASALDGDINTGWSSGQGGTGPAWMEVDLDAERLVSGVTLVNDRAERVPDDFVVMAERAGTGWRQVAALAPQGVTARWENGAIRITPSRTLTVRFEPVAVRRIRLVEKGAPAPWSVAELFVLGPAAPGSPPDPIAVLVEEGRRLENGGQLGPALQRYHEAMRRGPDDPAGFDAFARLSTVLRDSARSPLEYAARLVDLGLLGDARAAYADAVRILGPGEVHVELWRLRARLAAADGDAQEATRLGAEADAALTPPHPVDAVMGGQAELVGYDVRPEPLTAGKTAGVTTHWRLYRAPWSRLMVWMHFRADERTETHGTRFGDDYPLTGFLPELGVAPQHVSIERQLAVPDDATAGRYRIVAGLWSPGTGWRLRRWWREILPTLDTTLELGRVDVTRPAS